MDSHQIRNTGCVHFVTLIAVMRHKQLTLQVLLMDHHKKNRRFPEITGEDNLIA